MDFYLEKNCYIKLFVVICFYFFHDWLLYPPQTLFVVGILFSRCPCVRASVRP